MWLRLSRRIKPLISKVFPFSPFHAETQTSSFIHTCTHSLILSVRTRKLPCCAEVHTSSYFFKYWLGWKHGWGFLQWPHPGWSICWTAITLIGHLLAEWNVQHGPGRPARTSFWTWISVWGSGQQTCYVNDSRVTEMCREEDLSS